MTQSIRASAGHLTDRSGTIAAGAVSQVLMPANPDREYLLIQNLSTGDLWINFGGPATAGQPSVKLIAGATFFMEESFVSVESIDILGATAGQAFTAKES